jgi:TonB-linked SusC/RagA family outer membrane protein
MLKIYTNTKKSWRIPRWGILMMIFLVSFIPGRVLSQDLKLIKGTVTEASDGQPLPGVSVKVKGTTRAVSTNNQGQYSIQAKGTDVLVFTFVGSKAQEITVGARTTIEVKLADDATSLNETVIIGYGSAQKKDLTGAVGQVSMSDVAKAPVGSFVEALAGRVAGVQVSASDGQPGGSFQITVRGPGSLTQSTSPLFVVDGFPMEDLDPNSLNTDDIESMTILKDASAAAIYGSRAANGVVLIQTKKGKAGKAQITFNTSYGQNLKAKQIELMSPYEFVKYQNERFPGQVGAAEYIANTPLDYYKGIQGIDLQDKVFGRGPVKKYDVAVRGGSEQTRYALSGSIYNMDGTVVNTGLNKYTARLNLDHNISKKIRISFTGNYSGVTQFGQIISTNPSAADASQVSLSSYSLYRVWGYRPTTPPYIDPSSLLDDVDEEAMISGDYRINPVSDLENTYNYKYNNTLNAIASASYDIIDGLTFQITGGANRRSTKNDQFYNSKTSKGSPFNINNINGINGSTSNTYVNSWSNENTLNYVKVFNKDHTVKGLALFSLNQENRNANGYAGRLLPNESLGMAGIEQGLAFNQSSSISDNTRVSYATRWDYNYKSKYMVSGTLRADASSKFSEPWGYFPAASIGWNMQQENFMKSLSFVSNSKIRASFGIVGNDRVGDFDWYARLTQNLNGYGFNNATPIGGVFVSAVVNPDLKWEKTTSIDIGYELGLFKERVALTVDLYKKTTNNLLISAKLPPTTGFASAVKNIGKLGNKGLEFTLSTVNIQSKSFSWESSFNISFNRNTILALSDGETSLKTNASGFESQYNTALYIAEIGKPAGMMFGYVWDGNYQIADFENPSPGIYVLKSNMPSNGTAAQRGAILPGDIKYKDLNNDGIIDPNDKTIIGRGQALYMGGFNNNFTYKGFSLNAFFQWSVGNDIYNANRLTFEGNGNGRRNLNQYASYVNRWTPENPTNENFRTGGQGPTVHSSRVVEDGSFLRLKTIALSYSLPQKLIQKALLSRLSLNVSAQNLITWTKYSGLDPEVSLRSGVLTPGFDFSAYPITPTIVFGLNAAF